MSLGAKSFVQRWFVTTLGVLLASGIVSGVRTDAVLSLLAASLLLGILNAFLRPILLILALPLLLVTLGLFTFVINALLLYLVGNVVKGFHVDGFGAAFKASLVISFVSLIANSLLGTGEVNPQTTRRRTDLPPSDDGGGPVIDV
jgi:putative membrane protein